MPIRKKSIDLVAFEGYADEEIFAYALEENDLGLCFNGQVVWGPIAKAIVESRKSLAGNLSLVQSQLVPIELQAAAYVCEQRAVYIAIDFKVKSALNSRTVRADMAIRAGVRPTEFVFDWLSSGATAKMAQTPDAMDLKRIVWLPYTE